MGKTLCFSLLFLTSFLAVAQDTPRFELFGGYSYASASKALTPSRPNLNGWNAALAANANRWFGVVGDFSGYYGSTGISSSGIGVVCPSAPCPTRPEISLDTKVHTFLLGPQISLRRNLATPFAHALFGLGATSAHLNSPFSTIGTTSGDAFAMALGGGVDLRINDRLAWRVQPDYLQTHFLHTTQKNFRVSTGIVFKFGK